ncbi:Protein unc-80-like protein [Armadillidium vulgare]|nr:Protein unc-80-like protein [Armadillidium vulgare]
MIINSLLMKRFFNGEVVLCVGIGNTLLKCIYVTSVAIHVLSILLTPHIVRMDKGVDIWQSFSLGHKGPFMHLSKDTLDGDTGKDGSSKVESKTRVKKKEDPHPILKFLKTQVVKGLFAVPFSLIIKSIAVIHEDLIIQVLPMVWEMLLEHDNETRSFITANRTRRKIHAEMVKTALEAEEAKRRAERENFLLSAVPVTIQAAYEPSLHHVVSEEHEEGEENEIDNTGRPISAHHVCVAQQLFPSCLCSSVLTIIHLLDDPAVTPDGVAVYQTAEQVIWSCLVEDSALFLRFFLEKLTREKQEIMARLLRRLVRFIPRLPSQAAFALFNYLVGYVMFYTRSPQEGAQEHTAAALSILWMVVPSVHGIHFKDLKQIFRKEQCDAALLLTANIPSAKKIIVHGPGGADAGGIPSQFPIQEDTQFSQIHVEAVDFFGIPEDESKYYFLVDYKTNQIHNMHSYVRDFYFFKRSQYPQLTLVRMEPEAAFEALQKQAFMQKFLEIGKVLLAYSVLKRPDQRVFFLHEELTKLPSFPRKALEADFNLYKGGAMDKEIRGIC